MNDLVQVDDCQTKRVVGFKTKWQMALDCPRKRWWGYEFPTETGGLQGTWISIYLLIGSSVHEGLRVLFMERDIEKAVEVALKYHSEGCEKGQLAIDTLDFTQYPNQVVEWTVKQNAALIEAMLRGFEKRVFKSLLESYEILECEVDRLRDVGDGFQWAVKTDSLMMRRETNELIVMSFKALGMWGKKQERQYKYDGQQFGEPWGIEGIMADWFKQLQEGKEEGIADWYLKYFRNNVVPPEISGVMMGILLKGICKQDEKREVGIKVYSNPLIGGWKLGSITFEDTQWAFSYYVPKVSKEGNQYKGNLGSTWKRFFAWEEFPGGIKGWVDYLYSQKCQPEVIKEYGDPLLNMFEFSEPIPKNKYFQERWSRQMMAVEADVNQRADQMRGIWASDEYSMEDKMYYLDIFFPQNCRNCIDFNSTCSYDPLCWGTSMNAYDPIGSGLYKAREPHHELELMGEEG